MPVQSKPMCFNLPVLRSANKPPVPTAFKSNHNERKRSPPAPQQQTTSTSQPNTKKTRANPPKKEETTTSALDPDEEKRRRRNLRNKRRLQRNRLRLQASEFGLPSPRFLPNSTKIIPRHHPRAVRSIEFKARSNKVSEVAQELEDTLYVYVRPPDSDVSMADVGDDDFEDTFFSAKEAPYTTSPERRSPTCTKSPRPAAAPKSATPTKTPRPIVPSESATPTINTTPSTGSAVIQVPLTLARDIRRRIMEMKQLSIALARTLSCFERDFVFMGLDPGVVKRGKPRKGITHHHIVRKGLPSSVRRGYL